MTDRELLTEIKAFREDLKGTRAAVDALARTSFRQKVFNGLIIVLFVAMVVGGYLVWRNARGDRNAIRHESCVNNQASVINSRMANNLFFDALVIVLVDPNDEAAKAQADELDDELERQQREILPIPQCD